ncbi:MAG: amidase [Proteobacteria bacterium]|nr:amidase [Pseudomonadota bacterium]
MTDFPVPEPAIRQRLETAFARIDRFNPRCNAIVTENRAEALAMAETPASGPLSGLIVSVKDTFETAGLRSTASYPPLKDHVPEKDAAAVARIRAAGGILIGKTNTSPLAGDVQCRSPIFGVTSNPWDESRTSGGSSGGGGAAVALGFSDIDLASDLAGSTRIPAHFCGVPALKCTAGRFPLDGHIPPLPGSGHPLSRFQSIGLIGRSTTCLAAGLAALEGAPRAAPLPEEGADLRIALWTDFPGLPLCHRTKAALAHLRARLEGAGWPIAPIQPEAWDFRAAWRAYGRILGSEGAATIPVWLGKAMAAYGVIRSATKPIQRDIARGLWGSPRLLADALAEREALGAALDRLLESHHTLVLPVSATAAYPHLDTPKWGRARMIDIEGRRVPYALATIGLTAPFSLTGHPVAVVPVGMFDSLPVGVQLVGRRGEEARLLAHARRFERLLDWSGPESWRAP